MKMMKAMCIALLAGLIVSSTAAANIVVTWNPVADVPCALGGTVDIAVYADIPQADGIQGFGLDLYMDTAVATPILWTPGALWSDVYAATPDPTDPANVALNFAAITAFEPPADGVYGANVLLGTIRFQGVGLGRTDLTIGAHNPADLNEGFAKNPPPTGFVTFSQVLGGIIVPEPTTLALLGLGILGLIRRR